MRLLSIKKTHPVLVRKILILLAQLPFQAGSDSWAFELDRQWHWRGAGCELETAQGRNAKSSKSFFFVATAMKWQDYVYFILLQVVARNRKCKSDKETAATSSQYSA
jgi:hypothetical protein